MEIYTKEDLEIFSDKFENIINKVKLLQLEVFEPSKQEVDSVIEIIHKFIRTNDRKICGNYAIDFLLKDKNKNDMIYSDTDIPSISIYSPTPLDDLKFLCDDLHNSNFKYIFGRETQFDDLYTISVNQQYYINILYASENIYKAIPTIKINNFHIVHPHYLLINYYFTLTQPLTNYLNLKKLMEYTYKLQKYYPLQNKYKDLCEIIIRQDSTIFQEILNIVHTYLKSKKTIIIIGLYAYSTILQAHSIKNKASYVPYNIPYYEAISDAYVSDINELIGILRSTYKNKGYESKFKIIEHYPFLNSYGYNVRIYYENSLIFWGFDSNNKCTPYQKLTSITVHNNIIKPLNDLVQVGSFSLLVEMNLIISMYHKLNDNSEMLSFYQSLTFNLFALRAQYFKENNRTIMDKTAFQEITLQCMGSHTDPQREYWKKIDKKVKENTGPYTFKYDPSKKNVDITTYKFANSSSNPINNTKNLRLVQ